MPIRPSLTSNAFYSLPASIRTFASASQKVINSYEELPIDYKDQTGLPYAQSPLSQEEKEAIFGKNVPKGVDRWLRILHGRRVAGTLDDPNLPNQLDSQTREKALTWLRDAVPVDEVESAGLRAEQELADMEEGEDVNVKTLKRAESLGIYKPNSSESKDVYGKGVFEKMREKAEKAWEEEQKNKNLDEAPARPEKGGVLAMINEAKTQAVLQRETNPRLQEYLNRGSSDLNAPPEMSTMTRLYPSLLVVLAVVLASLIFTQLYTPPRKSARIWPDIPPSAATIIAIVAANAMIMLAWRIPPMWKGLNMYFLVSPGYPRAMSMIGNIFSHQKGLHFATNMLILWLVGVRLHDEVGRADFLAIYTSAGVIGSFISLAYWVASKKFYTSHLGASGAVCGIIGAYLTLNGDQDVKLLGSLWPESWPGMSSRLLLCLLLLPEIYGLTRRAQALKADHWAHLGGYATGIGAIQLMRIRAKRRRETEMERRKARGVADTFKPSNV